MSHSFDAYSIPIFFQDLQHAYSTNCTLESSSSSSSSSSSFNYIDYAIHEREIDFSEMKEFWHEHLLGYSDHILPLPYDRYPLNKTRSGRGITINFELSAELVDQMYKFAVEHELTLFQLGLASFYTYLFKLTQQTDLCVGTVTSNRQLAQLAHIIGFFVNTLPYRMIVKPEEDVIGNKSSMQTMFLLMEDTEDTTVMLESGMVCRLSSVKNFEDSTAKFDVTCAMTHSTKQNRSISLAFGGSLDLFDRSTINSMIDRFELTLLQLFSASEAQPLMDISLLTDSEYKVLRNLQGEKLHADIISTDSIHHQFVVRACDHPQKVSIILDEQYLSYAEVLYYAQQVAVHLKHKENVEKQDIIGICLERCVETVIGVVAVLMCNAIYCPLSPDDPFDRLLALIDEVQCKCILVNSMTKTIIADKKVIINEIVLCTIPNSMESCEELSDYKSNIAYIIFTSGSTGMPKAAPISHYNFLLAMASFIQSNIIKSTEIIVQMSKCSFDVHAMELMGSLTLGATLVLLRPNGNLDMHYLYHTIQDHQVTFIFLVPTVIQLLCGWLHDYQIFLTTLRCVGTGGKQNL
ncbi:hypothetical protein I4U23_031545 [Adineta vaga]|nr:hypothetical protein I4U23_031545 [Adineta vaga]